MSDLLDEYDAWEFRRARVADVVDGDTLDVVVDLGFNVRRTVRVRLVDVDTAEIHTVPEDSDEYARGQKHAQYVREWVAAADGIEWPLRMTTRKEPGVYGRYVADVVRRDTDASLTAALHGQFDDV